MSFIKSRWMFLTLMLCAILAAPLVGQEVAAETESALMGGIGTILSILGPALVGVLTPPIWNLLKIGTRLKGKLPAWAQQLTIPLLAYVLNWLGMFTNVVLPETLEMFDATNITALLSATLAMVSHEAKKRKEA